MTKLGKFTKEIKNKFGQRLKSVFVYGSKANAGVADIDGNADLMIIVENLSGEDIRNISKPAKKWMGGIFDKKKNPEPVFMGEKEWFNSADTYAMEYADIKESHKIIYGENLICNIEVKHEDLRLKCETETKNLLMKFRSHYLLYASKPSYLIKSVIPVVKTINAIFKTVLRLKNIEVSNSAHENLNKIAELYTCDRAFYEKILCFKEKYCSMSTKETIEIADKTVEELNKLLDYINNL